MEDPANIKHIDNNSSLSLLDLGVSFELLPQLPQIVDAAFTDQGALERLVSSGGAVHGFVGLLQYLRELDIGDLHEARQFIHFLDHHPVVLLEPHFLVDIILFVHFLNDFVSNKHFG